MASAGNILPHDVYLAWAVEYSISNIKFLCILLKTHSMKLKLLFKNNSVYENILKSILFFCFWEGLTVFLYKYITNYVTLFPFYFMFGSF